MTQPKNLTIFGAALVLCCISVYPQTGESKNVEIHVVDDAGTPVSGVKVSVSYQATGSSYETDYETSTNKNGIARDRNGKTHFDFARADSYTIDVYTEAPFSRLYEKKFDYPLPATIEITLPHADTGTSSAPVETAGTSETTQGANAQSAESTAKSNTIPVTPDGNQGSGDSTPEDNTKNPDEPGWFVQVLLALLPLIAFFGLREITVRVVNANMMRKAPKLSGGVSAAQEIAANMTAGATSSGDGSHPQVSFLELNSTSEVPLNGSAKDRWKRSLKMASRRFLVFLLSLWLQVGLAALFLWFGGDNAMWWALSMALAALYLTGVAFSSWMNTEKLETIVVILWVLVQTVIAIIAAGTLKTYWYAAFVPVVSGIALLVFGFRRLEKPVKADGNKRLLILRVFGSDKNAAYTFGKLMNKWRFVGSFSTIVDPSYIRFQFSALSPGNRRRSIGIALLYGMAASLISVLIFCSQTFGQPDLPSWVTALSFRERQNATFVALAPLAILPIFFYVRHRFIANSNQLDVRIDRTMRTELLPGIGGIFRGLAILCFDDVWRPAVGHMLQRADAVLMDLRSFVPERKGCTYEIGELIDHFPISRLLFLIDEKCDKQELYKLIQERWQTMSPTSPNQAVVEPSIKMYVAHKRKRKDVRKILALLSASVDQVAATQER